MASRHMIWGRELTKVCGES